VGTRNGAEWGRQGSKRLRRASRFEVVREGDHYRVRDGATLEFVGAAYRFADAAEHAYELEKQSKLRHTSLDLVVPRGLQYVPRGTHRSK
jgi:hypothetical protein